MAVGADRPLFACYSPIMQIRPTVVNDIRNLSEIDATIEASQYLHVDRSGEGVNISWKIEPRSLRSKLIDPNHVTDNLTSSLRHVIGGIEDGVAQLAEHEHQPVGLVVAQIRHEAGTLEILDLRVDYDLRRQGIGSALLFEIIKVAREKELRAVSAHTLSNNFPIAAFLAKTGFELTGLDTHKHFNHDLVKESVSLFWYLPLSATE
jgi:ribosomal protein S18 acetylase RimI-like enzyme